MTIRPRLFFTCLAATAFFIASLSAQTPTATLKTLYNFPAGPFFGATSTLVQGADGNFYGTSNSSLIPPPPNVFQGYASAFFRLEPDGTLAVLYDFRDSAAGEPLGELVLGVGGNFYGVSAGINDDGAIFRLTPAGQLTILHNFGSSPSDGTSPAGNLSLGRDGNFYGTTVQGATYGHGTLFQLTTGGTLTILHSFTPAEGVYPVNGVILASDGNFYGTDDQNGTSGGGTIYRVTPAGVVTILHQFAARTGDPAPDGQSPGTLLVEGAGGNFYGTTDLGGANDHGTIFRITPAGVLTTLHSFPADRNQAINSVLTLGQDGNLYGTSGSVSTPSGGGMAYVITPSEVFTDLHDFGPLTQTADTPATNDGGADPMLGLIQGSDGKFYGTTSTGGSNGGGTVFQLSLFGDLAFNAATYATNENARNVTLIVTRTGGSTGPVSVQYATVDGTAVANTDYVATGGVLSWADGDTSDRTIVVPIIDRGVFDGSTRAFRVALSNSTGANLDPVAAADVTISETNAAPLSPVITSARSISTQAGQPFVYQIVATNNPTSYAANGLPAGLTFDAASGLITGTPTASGTFLGGISATNAGGTDTETFALAVTAAPAAPVPAPVITSAAGASTQVGLPFTYQIAAANLPMAYGASGLPVGLGVDPSTGLISGTPSTLGTYLVTLSAKNAGGTATLVLTLMVHAPTVPIVSIETMGDRRAQFGVENGRLSIGRTGDTGTPLTVFYEVAGDAEPGVDYKLLGGQAIIPAGASQVRVKLKPLYNPANPGKLKARIVLLPASDGSYELGGGSTAKIAVLGAK